LGGKCSSGGDRPGSAALSSITGEGYGQLDQEDNGVYNKIRFLLSAYADSAASGPAPGIGGGGGSGSSGCVVDQDEEHVQHKPPGGAGQHVVDSVFDDIMWKVYSNSAAGHKLLDAVHESQRYPI
jgi:hypothetical protein